MCLLFMDLFFSVEIDMQFFGFDIENYKFSQIETTFMHLNFV